MTELGSAGNRRAIVLVLSCGLDRVWAIGARLARADKGDSKPALVITEADRITDLEELVFLRCEFEAKRPPFSIFECEGLYFGVTGIDGVEQLAFVGDQPPR